MTLAISDQSQVRGPFISLMIICILRMPPFLPSALAAFGTARPSMPSAIAAAAAMPLAIARNSRRLWPPFLASSASAWMLAGTRSPLLLNMVIAVSHCLPVSLNAFRYRNDGRPPVAGPHRGHVRKAGTERAEEVFGG